MTKGSKTRAGVRSDAAKHSGSSRQGAQGTPKKPSPRPGVSPGKRYA